MHDNLDPREGTEPTAPRTQQDPPMLDKELPASAARVPDAVHAWLDGKSVV